MPGITAATQRAVLFRLFRRYLIDQNRCNPQFDPSGNDRLLAARNAGQIVPSISDVVTGSFTGAARTETLYVISVNECNATHADNFGTKRVAIFSGQQLVADVDAEFRQAIVLKSDLNGEGIAELVMTTGDMGQGTLKRGRWPEQRQDTENVPHPRRYAGPLLPASCPCLLLLPPAPAPASGACLLFGSEIDIQTCG